MGFMERNRDPRTDDTRQSMALFELPENAG
jgi:hypothetical protein